MAIHKFKKTSKQFCIAQVIFFVISVLSFTIIISWGHLGLSQALSQKDVQTLYEKQGIVSRLKEPGEIGNLVYAPVKLDGKVLFLVAAPASTKLKKNDQTLSPIEARVESIERKLQGILQRGFNPETLNVQAGILNGQTVILVSDGKQLTPQPVLTITDLDAQLHGLALRELATEGSKYLHEILLEAWKERQPDYLINQGLIVSTKALGLFLLTGLYLKLRKLLKRQWRKSKEQLTTLKSDTLKETIPTQLVSNLDSLTEKK